MLKILVTFKPVGTLWRAEYLSGFDETSEQWLSSPVVGTIEETLGGLRTLLPNTHFRLTCTKCGNSESRDVGVSEITGVCEYCEMSPEEKRAIADAERRAEDYVFGPPDVDYPPDTARPEI